MYDNIYKQQNCFWQTIKFIYLPCLDLFKKKYYSKTCLCVQLASIQWEKVI